jgi:hypothetical protein
MVNYSEKIASYIIIYSAKGAINLCPSLPKKKHEIKINSPEALGLLSLSQKREPE